VELRRFFDRAIRATFADLALRDDPAAPYLTDLLTRFARTEQLFPRGVAVSRLETVVDMLLEVQAAWRDDGTGAPGFAPEREVSVRRHIGDYTLFMTGVFPERVAEIASTGWYVTEGKRAYHFVFEHDRAAARESAPVFRRLAERFEHYVGALDYARRVYFNDQPPHSIFRLGFG
jgi:hypothetical protein